MFSLSVFDVLSKVEPDLNSFSQDELRGFEIHLIDSERNKDGREFFMFAADDLNAAALADQSACVNCHRQEAKFESTYVQVYPKLKMN
jgi:cytochrome c553